MTLSSDEFEFYSLGELREIWQKLPNQDAINAVAEAHQYYDFLNDMIVGRVQSWSHPLAQRETWFTPSKLVLSARAGAISSCISVGSSIIECAMRSHAENRKIRSLMKKDPKHRTFGKVVHSWKNHGVFSNEISGVVADLDRLLVKRNNIHLYASFGESWEDKVNQETQILDSIERLFNFFQNLDPVNP